MIFQSISLKLYSQSFDTICAQSQVKVYRVKSNPGSNYYWSVNGGQIISSNIHADSIKVLWGNTPGIYEVKVIEQTILGCLGDTARISVAVNPKMHLNIQGPAELCIGQPVWLTASGANVYKWSTGESDSNIIVYLKDTFNKIQVIGKNSCETDTATWTIKVHPRPSASFTTTPQNPMVDESVFMQYTGQGATNWTWYADNQQLINGSVSEYETSFNEKGNKSLMLVSRNQFGCSDTFIDVIHIKYDYKISVPSIFTPDGNGINDSFKAIGFNLKSIHTIIYNRWGEKIYESFGVNDAWDGTFKGKPVINGVYVYMIDAEATDGEHTYLNGNVTVMN